MKVILSPAIEVEYDFILEFAGPSPLDINQRIDNPAYDKHGPTYFTGVGYVVGVSSGTQAGGYYSTVYVKTFQFIE